MPVTNIAIKARYTHRSTLCGCLRCQLSEVARVDMVDQVGPCGPCVVLRDSRYRRYEKDKKKRRHATSVLGLYIFYYIKSYIYYYARLYHIYHNHSSFVFSTVPSLTHHVRLTAPSCPIVCDGRDRKRLTILPTHYCFLVPQLTIYVQCPSIPQHFLLFECSTKPNS